MGHKSGGNAFYLLRPIEAGPAICTFTRSGESEQVPNSPSYGFNLGWLWVTRSCSGGVGFGSSPPYGYCFPVLIPSWVWVSCSRPTPAPLLSP